MAGYLRLWACCSRRFVYAGVRNPRRFARISRRLKQVTRSIRSFSSSSPAGDDPKKRAAIRRTFEGFMMINFTLAFLFGWICIYQCYSYASSYIFPYWVAVFLGGEEIVLYEDEPVPPRKPADRPAPGLCCGILSSFLAFRLYPQLWGDYTDQLTEKQLREYSVTRLRNFSILFTRGRTIGTFLVAAMVGGFVNGAVDNAGEHQIIRRLKGKKSDSGSYDDL
ncbi:hypothetical protein AAMO2058_000616200 [Amorphochlora amoebiformis]